MRTLTLVAVLLSITSATVPAQQPPSLATQLRVATPTYFADGQVRGASAAGFDLRLNQPVVTYATSGNTLCLSSSPVPSVPPEAGYGWRVELTAIKETAAELVVQVNWQRVWDRRLKLDAGRRGSAQLTLGVGSSVILDYLSPATIPDGPCTAVGMGLEIRLETPSLMDAAGLVETELWLVQHATDGTERSEKQVVRTRVGGLSEYFFETTRTPESAGMFNVLGSVGVTSIKDGKVINLKLTIARAARMERIDRETGQAERQVVPLTAGLQRGSTTYTLALTPGEVTSFQLPPVPVVSKRDAAGKSVIVYGASISVRIRARQIQ